LLTVIPEDYQLPLLGWFRGLSAEVTRSDDTLSLHADLLAELDRKSAPVQNDNSEKRNGWGLPSLNFLNPFGEVPAAKEAGQSTEKNPSAVPANKRPVQSPRQVPVPELLPVPKVGESG